MISDKALKMITHHEGLRQKPYLCAAHMWTIGVGHVLYPEQFKLPVVAKEGYTGMLRKDYPLKPEDNRVWSMEEINDILRKDLTSFERGVVKFCPVPLTQGMLDGLVSFSFNVGLGTLQRSTLRQKLNRGDKEGAADEFLKYTIAGGKVLKGLVNRRNDERAIFLG
jgi:lysozyme